MSSPLSNLKRGKRVPLMSGASSRTRAPPFRDEDKRDKDIIDLKVFDTKVPPGLKNQKSKMSKEKGLENDELLSLMMSRLTNVERHLKEANNIIKEKDKRIRVLEEKCSLLEKARGHGDGKVTELEAKCQRLQNQLLEMETFLEDYGMVWVGNSNGADNVLVDAQEDDDCEKEVMSAIDNEFWKPEASLSNGLQIDYDLILKNIKELNILAGEGEHVVKRTGDGARLQVKDSVPLTLFANGILMFEGPFRPLSDPETQQCIQDLTDGYFPSELQEKYPDGVPIQVTDMRNTSFREKRHEKMFPGAGYALSQQESGKESNALNSENGTYNGTGAKLDEISNVPGQRQQSIDQFLRKLPSSIVQKGRMVEVRSDIESMLKDVEPKPEMQIIETETEKELNGRLNQSADGKRRSSAKVTTLRVKSENGEKTYFLKMKYDETIKDLRKYIDKTRDEGSPVYQIKTTFPNRTYDDDSLSLKDCGLVPNATLHLTVKR